jgi:cytochrome P450
VNPLVTSTLDNGLARLFGGDTTAFEDPTAVYSRLQLEAPVHEFRGLILVSRYALGKSVILDAERFSSIKGHASRQGQALRASLATDEQEAFDAVAAIEAGWLTRVGGEHHRRLRAAAHRAFTPRRIATLEAATERYVAELADQLEGEVADLVPLAYGLPLMIVCDLLGVPVGDRGRVHGWSRRIGRNLGTFDRELLLDAHAAYTEFAAYVQCLIDDQRGGRGASDLVTTLVDAEEGAQLTTLELVAMGIVLLFAGHETTTNLIATGTRELLRHPDQWRSLAAAPERTQAAVEELLRWVSPIQWNLRQAAVDTELEGHAVQAGQDVVVVLAAVNRDPDVFERADEFDIARPDAGRHLAFGCGTHFCLGASLARLEARIALRTLATRFPRMELATDAFEWEGTANLRRLSRLPVVLGGRS